MVVGNDYVFDFYVYVGYGGVECFGCIEWVLCVLYVFGG